MSIKIVTDSTCDLPKEVTEALDISVIPLYINFPEKSCMDGIEITRKEFYETLPDYEVPPTTSVPSINAFSDVYKRLLAQGASAVISIHVSTLLSGAYNIASLAAETAGNALVKTFDANNLSLATGVVVEEAARLAQAGRPLDEILTRIRDLSNRVGIFAALDTLKFLRRSGRVSMIKASLGSLLQIKPVMKMFHGKVGMDAARTTSGAYKHLMDLIRSLGPLEQLHLVHTNAPEKAEELRREALELFPQTVSPYSVDVTPVIGSHIGPGAAGFVFVTAK